MIYFGMILVGAVVVGLVIGLMDPKPPKKERKPKKKTRSPWDKDPFFGTPLEKF